MGLVMSRISLPYVHPCKDKFGVVRYYFRRHGSPRVRLPGLPASTEFMEVYQRCVDGLPAAQGQHRRGPAAAGTVEALVNAYFASKGFLGLRASTRATYRGIIERFRAEHGSKRVVMLYKGKIEDMMAKKAETPAAANNFLRMLRTLMEFAVKRGLRADDPTEGIEWIKAESDGFHTWTEDEIAQFEKHWKIGTRARLAFALHLYTGQRRSDVVRMTWRDIEGPIIKVRQMKTGRKLEIPIHPDLQAALDVAPRDHISILTTQAGAPFAVAGYGNWFRDVTRKAGLPDRCAAHGLRKAAARRLAECGCSSPEIGAVTGHKTLREIERYIAAASQSKLATAAVAKLSNLGKKP